MNWDCQGRKFKARCWTVQYNKKGRTRIPNLGNPNEMIKILTILGLYRLSNKSSMGMCHHEPSEMIQVVSPGSWFCGHEQCSIGWYDVLSREDGTYVLLFWKLP